jgi:hypothetical protein
MIGRFILFAFLVTISVAIITAAVQLWGYFVLKDFNF